MNISFLDFKCLNAVTDDYENLSLIIKDVNELINDDFSEEEIIKSLSMLTEARLIAVFEYDTNLAKYIQTDLADGNWSKKWFLITKTGREVLDKHSSKFLPNE